MTDILSIAARGDREPRPVASETTDAELEQIVARAARASRVLADATRADRARLLRSLADALEADSDAIVAAADEETALGTARLTGELARSSNQLRLFAEVLDDGGYLSATIDHANPAAVPVAVPDIRRMLVPIGPVAVFSASNFPLAFSVPGGDTASAIAAGNAVVVKVHSGHPSTSLVSAAALRRGAELAGFPADIVSLVFGTAAGVELVKQPAIKAASFTGSVPGGRALFDIAAARPEPIPFFGELGSINAFVITGAAIAERGDELAAGLAGSFTLGLGQFCTKPGLLLVPSDEDDFTSALTTAAAAVAPGTMLNPRIRSGWAASIDGLGSAEGVTTLLAGLDSSDGPAGVSLYSMPASAVLERGADSPAFEEYFGPSSLVVTYADEDELASVLALVPGSLTGTVHATEAEGAPGTLASRAVALLTERCGRVLWNQFPTGVAVTWAQQHGGPYPATTSSASTSVGAASILRFLRAVAWQNAPAALLPVELRDDNPTGVPQRVDGRLL
ncbi:aldehyde dehydrogenase (NADP(+)) [soil metagenome]